MSNILHAAFDGGRSCRTRSLYQHDYGQVLVFDDVALPALYEVQFSNASICGAAVTAVGGPEGVEIPNALLETGEPVYAWVVLHAGESDGETVYRVTIPVIARPGADDATPAPEQQSAIAALIALLGAETGRAEGASARAEAAEAAVLGMRVVARTLPSGENADARYQDGTLTLSIPRGEAGATGPAGPQGPAGEIGPTGPRGSAPERGVDYWTPSDRASIVSEAVAGVLAVYPAAEEASF